MARRNREPYISRYLHSRGRKYGIPVSGTFELTARCNFDCPMCYVHLKQEDIHARGKELTAQQWIEIARAARDRGMMFVLLTGGESFVRKDFFEIYSAMQEMGLVISINTNGSMLSGEIRQKLIENPPARINISLYGGCGETYCNMCGQDMFRQVLENIRALNEAGVGVSINHSITPYNYRDLEKIDAISRELDIPVKTSSYMFPPVRIDGTYGSGNRLTAEEAAACTVQWEKLRLSREEFNWKAENMSRFVDVQEKDCPLETEEGVQCRAGSSSFWMTWEGKMYPCGMMPRPEALPLEIGFDAAWDQIRQETSKIRLPQKCTGCIKKDVCSVCAAACITETGEFDQVPEYVCRQTEATIEKMWQAYLAQKGEEHAD